MLSFFELLNLFSCMLTFMHSQLKHLPCVQVLQPTEYVGIKHKLIYLLFFFITIIFVLFLN